MSIGQSLLPEFDQEMAGTRRTLERVPSEHGAWKPHEKSFPLGHLAQLVARMPGWLTMIVQRTEIDFNPPGGRTMPGYSLETTETLLREFDDNVAKARAALSGASDEEMGVSWYIKNAGTVLSEMPRAAMVRQTISHLVHHRAQLGVYLRMLDVPVPALYGPSADERM